MIANTQQPQRRRQNLAKTPTGRRSGLWQRLFGGFRYHASEHSTRRTDAGVRVKTADAILDDTRRRRLVANTRDARKNFALAAWMIRRHLDYVTRFNFQSDTGDPDFDKAWLDLFGEYAKRSQCDVSGRRPLQTILRLAEAARTVDGDILIVRLADGRLQPIEGDRIRTPRYERNSDVPDNITHGVVHDGTLAHIRYAVHRRDDTGNYKLEQWVDAANAYFLGYYEEFEQVRGVSPLAAAINTMRDLYEACDYALAKMKVSQLLGLIIFRDIVDEEDTIPGALEEETDDDTETDQATTDEDSDHYQVDFGPGPWKLELDPGDKAEFLESNSPSEQFQHFTATEIAIALKSLDIPFSFWDESATNFYGSRAAAMQYERSCKQKREDLQDFLGVLTTWKTIQWIRRGRLILPAGLTLDRALSSFEWVHEGTPWWKPMEETNADRLAIRCGFKTHDQVTRERHGKPFRKIVDQLAAEHQYAKDKGVTLETAVDIPPAQPTPAASQP